MLRMPRNDREGSPPVRSQRRLAGLAQPRAILLQAGEHDHVTVIEMGAAEARGIARAGILALRGSACCSQYDKWNYEEKSEHFAQPLYAALSGVLERANWRGKQRRGSCGDGGHRAEARRGLPVDGANGETAQRDAILKDLQDRPETNNFRDAHGHLLATRSKGFRQTVR